MPRRFSLSLVLLAALLPPPPLLQAHDVEVRFTLSAPSVTLYAAYGGDIPVASAKVAVFAPGQAGEEFYSGRTDRRGYFSFVPSVSGAWRIVVDDEEGHRRELTLTVPPSWEPCPAASGAATPFSRGQGLLVGLSLLVGLTGFLYGFKARRRP